MTAADDGNGVDVLVVGLGPVGAVAALLASRLGMTTVAIDARRDVVPVPRAIAGDAGVLRILDDLGLPEPPSAAMLRDRSAVFVDGRGRRLLEVRPADHGLAQPGLSFYHQPTLERALRAGLAAGPGVDLRLGWSYRGHRPAPDGLAVDLEDPTGRRVRLRCRFLLGADGAGSDIRRGIGGRLRERPGRSWLVVDVATTASLPREFRYGCDPAGPWVGMPRPGGHRWEWLLPPDADPAAWAAPEHVRRLLAPHIDPADVTVERATVYRYAARIASRWRAGPVFLLGDAAHVLPPFAGLGLATGLRDAVGLCWRLDLLRRGLAGDALADSYVAERRTAAREAAAVSLLLGSLVQVRSRPVARLRDAVLSAGGRAPVLGGWLASGGPLPAPVVRGVRWGPHAGELLPCPVVAGPDGVAAPLHRLLGDGFALVARPVAPPVPDVWLRLGARAVGLPGAEGPLARLLPPGRVAVVRPDRHLLAVTDDPAALGRRWLRRFGPAAR